jgi:hypothetical protein
VISRQERSFYEDSPILRWRCVGMPLKSFTLQYGVTLALLWLLTPAFSFAQQQPPSAYPVQLLTFQGAPTGPCDVYQVAVNVTNGNYYTCNISTHTWLAAGTSILGINNTFSGSNTFTGAVTATQLNKTLYVTSAGSDGCAAIQAQISALPTTLGYATGVVDFTALIGSIPCGSTVNAGSPYLTLRGPGAAALIFNCTVNGDCFNTQESTGTGTTGFRISGFSLHGSGTANGVGIHAGDMVGGRFEDIAVDGFTGVNGVGWWFENKNYFFEDNIFINCWSGQGGSTISGNTKDFRWSVTTANVANSSFQYNHYYWLKYATLANQTSLSFEGGVHSGSYFNVTGNTLSATGTTFLAMSGSTFPTSGVNTLLSAGWYVKNECTGCSGASFYSIPSGYALTIESGNITQNFGFTYTVSGAVNHALNPSPLETPILQNYSATGTPVNSYVLVINNPATSRNLTLNDPGGNANWCLSLGCVLNGTGGGTTGLRLLASAADVNGYNFQVTAPGTNRNIALTDTNFGLWGNLSFNGVTNATGLQIFNTATSCTTAATINTPCTTASISLPVAYTDTNYRLGCSGLTRTNFPQIIDYTKSNTTFTITLNNLTAAAATYANFDCWVTH